MRADLVIAPIKKITGLDITLYSSTGDLEGATGKAAPFVSDAHFSGGVFVDSKSGCTYFTVETKPKKVGAISGVDEVSVSYAQLAAKIIAHELNNAPDANERMRLLLSGEATEAQIIALKSAYVQPFNYYVFALVCRENRIGQLMSFMNEFKENDDILVKMDAGTLAYARACKDDDEYQSANEFANVLHDNLSEELPFNIKICIGEVAHSFEGLEPAFSHALFACHYGQLVDPAADVYSYKEYVLIKMLAEVKRSAFSRYASVLIDKNFEEVLKDSELLGTAEMFMKNSLNISETSRSMYMHRNTLIYRLDKIEKATGLNIRQFNDAFTFRLILLLNKLTVN